MVGRIVLGREGWSYVTATTNIYMRVLSPLGWTIDYFPSNILIGSG
jgi:hypothetical protein